MPNHSLTVRLKRVRSKFHTTCQRVHAFLSDESRRATENDAGGSRTRGRYVLEARLPDHSAIPPSVEMQKTECGFNGQRARLRFEWWDVEWNEWITVVSCQPNSFAAALTLTATANANRIPFSFLSLISK